MTGGASLTPDPIDESPLDLPSAAESGPVDYVLAVDQALWDVSERLISRKHPSTASLTTLRGGLVTLTKFIRQMMYPRQADAVPDEPRGTLRPHGESLLGMLSRTLSSLSDYIEILEELGPTGTIAIQSPADLGDSADVKGAKRDTFITEFNQLQFKFQEAAKPLRT